MLATTATIDNPGAQSMGWRMHGDACARPCARLGEHREAAKSFRKSVADMDPRDPSAAEMLAQAAASDEAADKQNPKTF